MENDPLDSVSGDVELTDECAEATEAAQTAIVTDTDGLEASEVNAHGGLGGAETQRFKDALQAIWSIPFIGDIRDFVWEAVFAHVKGLPIPDPLTDGTRKLLFDIVDKTQRKGWSQKALQLKANTIQNSAKVEFVIQRADIFEPKNAEKLGHPEGLSRDTDESTLGKALINYWQDKVKRDAIKQGVDKAFVGVLLKNRTRTEYLYFEHPVPLFDELLDSNLYEWRWTDTTKKGLQAVRTSDGKVALRWYPNQKQMFECLTIPADAVRISLNPRRMTTEEFDTFIEAQAHPPKNEQAA